jgi:hypothetical protein
MRYLILRQFISYGKLLKKGTIVDASEVRSPVLRLAEGKIAAVPSFSATPAVDESASLPQEPEQEPENITDEQKETKKLFTF